MRRFLKLQWMMVAVIIVAILTWGVPPLLREARHRRRLAQSEAAFHAREAARFAALATRIANRSPTGAARYRERSAFHARRSKDYRRVLNQPWKLYPLAEFP
jgi:hypothetical protein